MTKNKIEDIPATSIQLVSACFNLFISIFIPHGKASSFSQLNIKLSLKPRLVAVEVSVLKVSEETPTKETKGEGKRKDTCPDFC